MPATFNATNPVAVGLTAKVGQYARVFNNTLALKEGGASHDYLRLGNIGAPTPIAGEAILRYNHALLDVDMSINGGAFRALGVVARYEGTVANSNGTTPTVVASFQVPASQFADKDRLLAVVDFQHKNDSGGVTTANGKVQVGDGAQANLGTNSAVSASATLSEHARAFVVHRVGSRVFTIAGSDFSAGGWSGGDWAGTQPESTPSSFAVALQIDLIVTLGGNHAQLFMNAIKARMWHFK